MGNTKKVGSLNFDLAYPASIHKTNNGCCSIIAGDTYFLINGGPDFANGIYFSQFIG